MKFYVGTAGYEYAQWKGNKSFYPQKLPNNQLLGFYSSKFNIVEINNTFYKFPNVDNTKKWYSETPDNFAFIIKMNMYITHYKKLLNIDKQLKQFLRALIPLKNKLKCILFQFSKNFVYNQKNIDKFIDLKKILPAGIDYAFEFRNKSWFNIDSYKFFNKLNWIFVIWFFDTSFHPELNNSVRLKKIYIRIHGTTDIYQGSLSSPILKKIYSFCEQENPKLKQSYIIFNNTDSNTHNLPDAIYDAQRLNKIIKKN